MVHIKITKGLDIPITGKPDHYIHPVESNGHLVVPKHIGLDLSSFDDVKFRLLCKPEDVVKIGQPLAEDKDAPGRLFVSPAGGIVKEIRRGLKRRLLCIVIEVAQQEEFHEFPTADVSQLSQQDIKDRMMLGGLFAHVRQRPFNLLADPRKEPRAIFVKALESAPFAVPPEFQVSGYEKEFQMGLTALSKLTKGPVHLVYSSDTTSTAFTEAQNVQRHTAEGPHPVGNHSVHIHFISPIRHPEEVVWTLNVSDVIGIGSLFTKGRYHTDRILSIGGPGILPERVGFVRGRMGYPIQSLVAGRIQRGLLRFISGDVLMEKRSKSKTFWGFPILLFVWFQKMYPANFSISLV